MDFDVLIIGGGWTGLALAASLRDLRVALIEARPLTPACSVPPGSHEGWDSRIYAISPANQRFLASIEVWDLLDSSRITPVYDMQIEGDCGARLDFSAYGCGIPELAWIVESTHLEAALYHRLAELPYGHAFRPAHPVALDRGADHVCLTLSDGQRLRAALVVGADGANSWIREQAEIPVWRASYPQHAVVANFRASRPLHHTARQWFGREGILAWLPLPHACFSMVWSTSPRHAAALCALSAQAFSQRVRQAGDPSIGPLECLTPPRSFPLHLMRAASTTAARLMLIGDAAHAVHPLSGHGINLGLQDAMALAHAINNRPAQCSPGDPELLRRVAQERLGQVIAVQSLTDFLYRLFASPSAPLAALRNCGLAGINRLPGLRNRLALWAAG
jgi:2-octaprenylphenol hydroxylase